MNPENLTERAQAAKIGKKNADEIIGRAQELFDEKFYSKKEHKEVLGMLRAAGDLTQDPAARKEIDRLLTDIESEYGSPE